MWKTVICDDETEMRRAVKEYLSRFSEETGELFSITEYDSGEALLFNLTEDADIVFLDIAMGGITGMDAAKKLRDKNNTVCIVFITTMTQYAIEGYAVHAFGFLKKPVSYAQFRLQMTDVLRHLKPLRAEALSLKAGGEIRKIHLSDIIYLEVLDHDMRFVLSGDSITSRITMKELDEGLKGRGFFRCHKGYTVSLDHVRRVAASGIIMDNGDEVPLSKHRRKEFLEAYANYIGGGAL